MDGDRNRGQFAFYPVHVHDACFFRPHYVRDCQRNFEFSWFPKLQLDVLSAVYFKEVYPFS